ncbi:MAG: hypothetical protein GY867_02545 [bacterium]|nr:hypothetical protein [bacterium]
MKLKFVSLMLMLLALGLVGCDDDDNVVLDPDPIPASPQGVFSITGDDAVYVFWNGIYERDVDEYVVYRSLDAVTGYEEIAVVDAQSNSNLDLIIYQYADDDADNGTTYWYAVTAVDRAGQESDLSAEDVFDTPRPDGQASIFFNDDTPALAGFNLGAHANVPDTSTAADVWMDRDLDGIPYLNVGNIDTDIQDMGFTNDFDGIGWSPEFGWSELGYVEIVLGHTYVIWTADNHFAKMRALSFNTGVGGLNSVTFEWAYQTDQGNLELAPSVDQKPEHGDDYVKPRPTLPIK